MHLGNKVTALHVIKCEKSAKRKNPQKIELVYHQSFWEIFSNGMAPKGLWSKIKFPKNVDFGIALFFHF